MTTLVHWSSALDNHLWQSTVFAVIAWLLVLALRKNQARTRYWLWMIASAKFLVPFSLLVAMGGYLREMTATPIIARPGLSAVIEQVATPFPQMDSAAVVAPAELGHSDSLLPMILFAVWICGFLFVAISWHRRWWRVRAAARSASLLPLVADVPVLSSRSLLEPGIFGISRPVLLLPEGISDRLTLAQMDAIVAHEMCHVRRRDNLTAAIHMAVEAVFWFHPLVWWIGSRMVEERERACDEEVLRLGGDPEIYAEGILNVCKFYVESPLTCVSGISSSDLKDRIVRIMTKRLGGKLSPVRKVLLAAVGIAAGAIPVVFGLLISPQARAQSQAGNLSSVAPAPAFDVTSVKPTKISGGRIMFEIEWRSPGEFNARAATLQMLIQTAYGVREGSQISGAPDWYNSARYDIDAKTDESTADELGKLSEDQRGLEQQRILQALLTDRFRLSVHRGTKELPIYALVVAKGGPKLHESNLGDTYSNGVKGPDGSPAGANVVRMGRGMLTVQGEPLADLVELLSRQRELRDRPVVDQTGLKGKYDFALQWTPQDAAPNGPQGSDIAPAPDSSGLSIFTALQDQLGLKLESTKGPVDTIVIEHIEEPSSN